MLRRIPWVLATLLLIGGGCMELGVTNPNNPDRLRATATPLDVQTIITSSFTKYFVDFSQETRGVAVSAIADEFSSNFLDFGQYDLSRQPREAYINQTSYTYASAAANPWIEIYSALSSANDGLQALDRGVVVMVPTCGGDESDQTVRARAFAKFMQGLTHGFVALSYDQGFVTDEFRVLEEDPPSLQPAAAVMDSALVFLRDAITLAEGSDFELCAEDNFIPGVTLSNEELAQLGHTMIARFLAYLPRTPAERADISAGGIVDWQEVLDELDAGLQRDVSPVGTPDEVESGYKFLIARQRSVDPGPSSDHTRVDYMVLGPADTSGKFQAWLAKDWSSTNTAVGPLAFQLETPDRRIYNIYEDAPPPDTARAYFGYHPRLLGNAARGLYLRSHYSMYRVGRDESYRNGPLLWLTKTELDLLRAEALIRLGRADEAVPLINLTRVANGRIPPVTLDGPPAGTGCVPRKFDGTCGSLWDALRYEKRIEMVGVDPWIHWYDMRGWGALAPGALLHFPVPAREIEILEIPGWTTGGNNPGSAGPRTMEQCPVPEALARCP